MELKKRAWFVWKKITKQAEKVKQVETRIQLTRAMSVMECIPEQNNSRYTIYIYISRVTLLKQDYNIKK
jgi:hypothetical protein